MVKLAELQKFLVDKAIIFPTAEMYGSFAGFFDYGPLGVEIKRAVKQEWWNRFVSRREVVGMDGCIITHPKVWEASGHIQAFQDPLVECKKCKMRFRADQLVETKLKMNVEGLVLKDLGRIMREHDIDCQKCGGELIDPRYFNLMFSTEVGAVQGNTAYLRPETAQVMFVDFPRIFKSSRGKLPFGIAQIGRSFRNEISPRNFVFRGREFEQMEIEYFFNKNSKPTETLPKMEVTVWTRSAQEKKEPHKKTKISELLKLTSEWHVYWIAHSMKFLVDLGLRLENLRLRQHTKDELSHYAKDTWDIDYNYPFGWKEMVGISNRADFDLKQHSKFSGNDLSVLDGDERVYPFVMEPSFGVDRLVMALLIDAWHRDDERQTLKLNPKIAPVQVAVFPLVNKESMPEKSMEVFNQLSNEFRAFYDDKGSIGRRYRRQDSIGTPFCITIDGQTLEDDTITLRHRDSMNQERVKIGKLSQKLSESF
ncbi:MAG: glycine--tRNA ligase [Candidatus Altiarchaeota archaeon]|nr:glycine--tRNA ligase [Candidatus Altiarchaeota archaeon]